MAEYTPTTEEVRKGFSRSRQMPQFQSPSLQADFDRWLAAHDAEKDLEIAKQSDIIALLREDEAELHRIRTSVVAEDSEWEYAVDDVGMHPDGTYWRDRGEKRPINLEATLEVPGRLRHWYGVDSYYRRRPAGPWVPVKQEGAGDGRHR